jgi:uncharacterized membrane protein
MSYNIIISYLALLFTITTYYSARVIIYIVGDDSSSALNSFQHHMHCRIESISINTTTITTTILTTN